MPMLRFRRAAMGVHFWSRRAPARHSGGVSPRALALRWAAGVVILGNAAHLLWGERGRPSETYTFIKIAGLVPLVGWGVRARDLALRSGPENFGCMPLLPSQPGRETLAGLGVGALLAAPLLISRMLAEAPRVPVRSPVAALSGRALVFRVAVSLPLTGVFLEELLFRCLLHRRLERASSPGRALLGTSVLFGLWHCAAGAHSVAMPALAGASLASRLVALLAPPLGTLPAGLAFGWLAGRYRTLWAPLVAHWLAATALLAACRKDGPPPGSTVQ